MAVRLDGSNGSLDYHLKYLLSNPPAKSKIYEPLEIPTKSPSELVSTSCSALLAPRKSIQLSPMFLASDIAQIAQKSIIGKAASASVRLVVSIAVAASNQPPSELTPNDEIEQKFRVAQERYRQFKERRILFQQSLLAGGSVAAVGPHLPLAEPKPIQLPLMGPTPASIQVSLTAAASLPLISASSSAATAQRSASEAVSTSLPSLPCDVPLPLVSLPSSQTEVDLPVEVCGPPDSPILLTKPKSTQVPLVTEPAPASVHVNLGAASAPSMSASSSAATAQRLSFEAVDARVRSAKPKSIQPPSMGSAPLISANSSATTRQWSFSELEIGSYDSLVLSAHNIKEIAHTRIRFRADSRYSSHGPKWKYQKQLDDTQRYIKGRLFIMSEKARRAAAPFAASASAAQAAALPIADALDQFPSELTSHSPTAEIRGRSPLALAAAESPDQF